MIKKIVLALIFLLGLATQSQTKKQTPSLEVKVKNYVKWFESLPDYKKREESIILVNKLNSLSPRDKGMWLALMTKYSTKEVKKNVADSLSNEGVKKKLLATLKSYNLNNNEKVDTIIIIRATTGKERTFEKNAETIKRIADLKAIITQAEKKMDSIGGDVDFHYHNGNIVYMNAYHDAKNANYELPLLRDEIILYRGVGDDNWNSYLKDLYEVEVQLQTPHILTDEELDSGITSTTKFDTKKFIYVAKFIKGFNYYDGKIRDDKSSTFSINEKHQENNYDD